MEKKLRKQTRRGAHYRELAEGYAMLNYPVAESFHRAADHFDRIDPPIDLAAETKEGQQDSPSIRR